VHLIEIPQVSRNLVVADQNATSTSRDQTRNLENSNSNSHLKSHAVVILEDKVDKKTSSNEDTMSNSKEKAATIVDELEVLNSNKGNTILFEEETVGTTTNVEIHVDSVDTDSLDVTEGQEAKSEDELDLVADKFMEKLDLFFGN
ncbi:hypothetical protein ACH5RR_001035, partial [Cinchona calisaya]